MTTLKARWVMPIDAAPIEGGAIVMDAGRIVWVGRAKDAGATDVIDLGDCIVMPGLINAHTHLELGWCRGRIPPRPLFEWFDELIRMNFEPDAEESRRRSIVEGAAESLRSGVTCVADISRTGINADALRSSPIRRVCFLELISGARSLPNDLATFERRLAEMAAASGDERSMLGLSPHTPYTVTARDLAGLAALATRRKLPLMTHLLETADERDWYAGKSGAVDRYLQRFNYAREEQPPRDPIEYLSATGVLNTAPLLAHVNYVSDEQIARLAAAKASVVFCPRTHAYFAHLPHRWRDMLAAGLNVCIGTDSLASAPSLSVLKELRHLRKQHSDVTGRELLEMATLRAAHALNLADCLGTLAPQKHADLCALRWDPDAPNDPYENVLHGAAEVDSVWIAAQRAYRAES